jgi:hypothetical protein
MLAIRKFILENNVTPLFVEGILGREFRGRKFSSYICSAIDLFVEMDYTEKKRVLKNVGEYVRGDKKGQPKYQEVTEEVTERVYAIIDLKSNYNAKESKSFYESHKQQLIFGRDLIAYEFGMNTENIKMFNLSTAGWNEEPKYILKEHVISENANGYDDSELLYNRLKLLVAEGYANPTGYITDYGDIRLDSINITRKTYNEFIEEKLREI